ncbi:MAG: branched-chain amino acid ABC transporter permease [Chloroflexi bacterium]|nr:MAG: branched-chain amino acid ABC transporter permease [Chloroflexota bacterium]
MEAVGEFLRAYSTLFGGIGISCLLALSIWVTLYAGQLTLGNAAFMGVAAYTAALLTLKAQWPFPVALLAGAAAATALSLPLGLIVFRLRGVYLAIATLAFGEMVRIVILALPITGRGQGLNGIPPKTSVAAVAYVLARVRVSTLGRAWAAIREDELAAAANGIAVRRYTLAAFVIGAAVASWAGGLSAHQNFSIDPGQFGFSTAVQILVMAVVGGIPNVLGPLLGAALLTALPELLRFLREYRDIFQGAILILVIAYLPRGLITLFDLARTRRLMRIGQADVA